MSVFSRKQWVTFFVLMWHCTSHKRPLSSTIHTFKVSLVTVPSPTPSMSLTKWCWFLTLHFILLIVSHSLLRLHDKVLRSTVWSVCALSIKKPSFFLVLQGLSWNIISYFLYSHCFVLRCCVNETTYPCQIQHHYIFICTLICSTCTDCTVSQCSW